MASLKSVGISWPFTCVTTHLACTAASSATESFFTAFTIIGIDLLKSKPKGFAVKKTWSDARLMDGVSWCMCISTAVHPLLLLAWHLLLLANNLNSCLCCQIISKKSLSIIQDLGPLILHVPSALLPCFPGYVASSLAATNVLVSLSGSPDWDKFTVEVHTTMS